MGRASRNKRQRRRGGRPVAAGDVTAGGVVDRDSGWAATAAARRCVRLLDELRGDPHPCLLTVLLNAVHEFLDTATARDPGSEPTVGWAYLNQERDPRQWGAELERLGSEIERVNLGSSGRGLEPYSPTPLATATYP